MNLVITFTGASKFVSPRGRERILARREAYIPVLMKPCLSMKILGVREGRRFEGFYCNSLHHCHFSEFVTKWNTWDWKRISVCGEQAMHIGESLRSFWEGTIEFFHPIISYTPIFPKKKKTIYVRQFWYIHIKYNICVAEMQAWWVQA